MKTFKECFDAEFKVKNGIIYFTENDFVNRTSINKDFFKTLLTMRPELFPYIYFITNENKLNSNEIELFYSGYEEYLNDLKNGKVVTDYKIEEVELIYRAETLLIKKEEERNFDDFLVCINYSIEHPFFFERLGIGREDWINSLVWKDKTANELHPYLKNNLKQNELGYKIINYLIRNWFLPRYDFDSIRKLKAHIPTRENRLFNMFKKVRDLLRLDTQSRKLQKQFSKLNIPINIIFSIIPTLILSLYLFWDKIKIGFFDIKLMPLAFGGEPYTFYLKGKELAIIPVFNTPEVFFELLFIMCIIVFFIQLIRNPLQKYLISPRLLIGILLGYLASLGGSSYWTMTILSFSNNNPLAIILTNVLLLFIVFLYIRYEVRKSIGDSDPVEEVEKLNKMSNNYKINIRSIEFFRKAVWSSFFIGLIIVDAFFIVYLRNIESALGADSINTLSHRFHTGIIGIIDPVLILFFFPLALISGVVIKFILDETPITHPIK